jgi:hypothetical protein
MSNLSQRVAKLEDIAHPDGRIIVMWKHVDETNAQARERWRKEHPGQDPDAADLKAMILRWSKSGKRGAWRIAGGSSDAE